MEQIHLACSDAGRHSFLHVVNHLGQNRASVVITIDVLALLKHFNTSVRVFFYELTNLVDISPGHECHLPACMEHVPERLITTLKLSHRSLDFAR